MKTNIKISILAVALAFASCSKKDDVVVVPEAPLTSGTANFSKYVAVGNSLSAGFSDGALFKEGQKGSWTNILNEQFKLVGGGNFNIPFMPDDNIGGILLGTVKIQEARRYWTGTGLGFVGTPTSQFSDRAAGSGFNNMGVPGAKVFHLLAPGYGSLANLATGRANPYFCRFASTPNARIIDDATVQNPTFFSLWIGNNDVLSYATSGGTGISQLDPAVSPATYGPNDITNPLVFAGAYNAILNGTTTPIVAKGLTSDGAKGVVCNIPYVTSVPFFTTVTYNAIPALPAADAASLNQLFGAINQIAAAGTLPARFKTVTVNDGNATTIEANNPLLIIDQTLVDLSPTITAALTPGYGAATAGYIASIFGQARHATKNDFILLTTGSILREKDRANIRNVNGVELPPPFNVNGISYPLQDSEVLTAAEVMEIKTATDAYNVTIKSLATAKGLAFVDTNSFLNTVATTGISANGYTIKSTYPAGGAFSLDGIHPCARGYALIANKVMEAINATYGSNLKPVDLTKYRVQYPKSF